MVSIRKARLEDELLLLEWVNNLDSLSTKIENNEIIAPLQHKKWFMERLNDPNTYIWIIINEEKISVGQIRFQNKTEKYLDVDIYVLREEREKSIGHKALKLAAESVEFSPLRAIVKKTNVRSYNFFISNAFTLQSEDEFKWVLIKN